jgi:hypothetical protein
MELNGRYLGYSALAMYRITLENNGTEKKKVSLDRHRCSAHQQFDHTVHKGFVTVSL